METVQKNLFSALRFEIDGAEIQKNQISENLPAVYKLAKFHDLAHLLTDVLDKNGLLPQNEEIKKRLLLERNMAVFRYEQSKYELEELCQVLEEAKILHIPLKGSILREYYPEPWMRTSCDIDVLVKKEDLEKAIAVLAEKLEYRREAGNAHDISLFAPSGVHVELHFNLIEDHLAPESVAIYQGIWERTRPCKGYQFRLEMTDEAFYFYHIGHMAKHFTYGGCGIRPFLDIWVLNHRIPFEKEKRDALLRAGGLLVFAQSAEELSEVWFSDKPHTALTQEMENYILQGGVYGTQEQGIAVNQAKQGGKLKYIWWRIFPSYDYLCTTYPNLRKRKWAYPFYAVRRWFRLMFRKGSIKKSMTEIKTNSAVSEKKAKRLKKLFHDVGL